MSSSSASPESVLVLFSASCRPPPLRCPDASTADWILLEPLAYVADRTNATTAEASSSTGYTIQATFCVADPPGVSYVCIHCPGLEETDFPERPRIIYSDKDLLLFWVTFKIGLYAELELREYFVYKAALKRPSLHLLPDPHPLVPRAWEVGLVPHGEDGHFVITALCLTQTPWVYDLHLFSSMTWAWSKKVLSMDISDKVNSRTPPGVAHKVISFGGGVLGWVDLWRGILICNVLEEMPVMQFIQLPMLLPGNKENIRMSPWNIRDVAYSDGLIKIIELETYTRQADESTYYDMDTLYDSDCLTNEDQDYVGWRIIIWHRMSSWNYWRKKCMHYDEEISADFLGNSLLHFQSKHINDIDQDEELTLNSLFVSYPVLSLNRHGEDVVYLFSKLKSDTQKMWSITVDLKMKKLVQLTPFSIKGYFSPAYPCQLSKYLNGSLASGLRR